MGNSGTGREVYFIGGRSSVERKILTAGLAILLIVEAAVNIPVAVQGHFQATSHLEDARDLASIVKPGDSVVLDFDDVSMLWLAIWGYGTNTIVLPASAPGDGAQWLGNAEKDATAKNGALLFVSVLDQDRRTWDAFLGRATGISYADFDCFRQKSAILRRYQFPENVVSVRELRPPFSCPEFAAIRPK